MGLNIRRTSVLIVLNAMSLLNATQHMHRYANMVIKTYYEISIIIAPFFQVILDQVTIYKPLSLEIDTLHSDM